MKFRIVKETRHDRPNHPRYYAEYQNGIFSWKPVLLFGDLNAERKYLLTIQEAEIYIDNFKREMKTARLRSLPPKLEVVKEIEC